MQRHAAWKLLGLVAVFVTFAHCRAATKTQKPAIKVEHGEGDTHDSKYDHQAILGSEAEQEAFETYSREEAMKKLGELVDRMDLDHDGFINKIELTSWIKNSFKSLRKEDLEHSMKVVDEDQDGFLTWPEYMKTQHGYDAKQLEEVMANKENEDDLETIEEDKRRFEIADLDHDGKLTMDEYEAIDNPEESDVMRDFEASETLNNYDADKDGMINLHEFSISEGTDDADDPTANEEDFKQYDENGDGLLDRREIANWMLPVEESTADNECEHLMTETDKDKDGKLAKEEILEQYDLWVGSHATNYGEHLHQHDPSEL